MIAVVVIVLALAAAAILIRRPSHPDRVTAATRSVDHPDRYRMLLRQLRDLDDDLAEGKLTEEDHARLSAPVARQAAVASREAREQQRDTEPSARAAPPARSARSRATRWAAIGLALAGAAAGVSVLLVDTANPRAAGQPISGDAPVAAAKTPNAAAPSSGGPPKLTGQQAAAIAAAVADVKDHPKDLAAHLALAHAYADGGATQLAAVEYLAITRLDPGNAEANTALALLAFELGHTQQAVTMVDHALAAHPDYPEGLYVRGLIRLMGLRQPDLASRDLKTYLTVAPFGSHRTAAQTLLALAGSGEQR